jgi:O-antigen ligase
MTGTVVLITVFSVLMVLSVVNRRWLMFGILLVGGFPMGIFAAQDRFFGLYANGVYLFVILFAVLLALLYSVPTLLSLSLRFYGYVIFLLYCLASLLWTTDIEWGLRMLIKLAAPFVFFISMQSFLKSDRDFMHAERSIIIACLIVSTLAIINTLGNGVLAPDDNMFNVLHNYLTAPFMSPANYSFFIGSGAILCLSNIFNTKKPIYFFLTILLSFFLFWSFVRISMFGLIAAFALIYFLLSKNLIIKIMVPIIIVVVFTTCFFTLDKFRARMFKTDKVTLEMVLAANGNNIDKLIYTSGRSTLWREVYREFVTQSPLIGKGVGSTDSWLEMRKKGRLHSEYLRILCDTGIIGLFLYLGAIFQFYILLIRKYLSSNDNTVRIYSARALAGLTFYLFTLATDNSLNYISEFSLYIFTFMAFAFMSMRKTDKVSDSASVTLSIQSSHSIPGAEFQTTH